MRVAARARRAWWGCRKGVVMAMSGRTSAEVRMLREAAAVASRPRARAVRAGIVVGSPCKLLADEEPASARLARIQDPLHVAARPPDPVRGVGLGAPRADARRVLAPARHRLARAPHLRPAPRA